MLSEAGLIPETLKKMQDRGCGCGKEGERKCTAKLTLSSYPSVRVGVQGQWVPCRERQLGSLARVDRALCSCCVGEMVSLKDI